jgi:hypothetical protein
MPWSGPQSDRCQLKDLAPESELRFPEDDMRNIALNGYETIARRPRQAIAGEIEPLEEADRQDEQADEMESFRSKYGYGGYGSDPGFGRDF